MRAWSDAFVQRLLEAKDYRSFLIPFFDRTEFGRKPRPISFQEFADRAGFASKTFLNDVIKERKRLSPTSIHKTMIGLGLSPQWQDYFHSLVASQETSFQSTKFSAEYFAQKAARTKIKIQSTKRSRPLDPRSELVQMFLNEHFPEVYAALGNTIEGASLEEICQRANLPPPTVTKILAQMESTGAVRIVDEKYIPSVESMDAEELRSADVFRAHFFRSLEKAGRRFNGQADSMSSLFMTQTFSVSQAQLPQLKKRLADVIASFADEAEETRGETIAEVCLSFTNSQN